MGGQPRRTVLGQFSRVPLEAQGAFKGLAHRRLVVYDQDPHVSTYFRTAILADRPEKVLNAPPHKGQERPTARPGPARRPA